MDESLAAFQALILQMYRKVKTMHELALDILRSGDKEKALQLIYMDDFVNHLEEEINESKTNTTRFAVFTAAPALVKKEDEQFVLMFSSKNEPGALGEAIAIIGRRGFNLRCLKSHPTGEENWAYYFYVEGDGNLGSEAGRQMLEELKSVCSSVRLMGSFGRERVLREEPEGKE